MDGRVNNAGVKGNKGGGRKSKVEEEQVNVIFLSALKELYKKDTDVETKKAFVKELAESQRGQMFIAEHIFGKPKERIENYNFNQELTKEDAKIINDELESKY